MNRKPAGRLSMLQEEEATGELAQITTDIRNSMGIPYLPNFFKVQAVSPSVLMGSWHAIRGILLEGVLPNVLKQMIFVAISASRGCKDCTAVHSSICRMAGAGEDTIHAIIGNLDALTPSRTQDVIKFAVKCAANPAGLTDADFDEVRQHIVSDQELMEIIAMSALAVYCNTIADATNVEVESPIINALHDQEES